MISFVREFLKLESASGIMLLAASILAMILANSLYAEAYEALLAAPIGMSLGESAFSASLHFWINDGLMAIFFLLVGLEIKHEMYEGELSNPGQAVLPVVAALGGVLLPALIYAQLNWHTEYLRGWAIPSATDIAFSLGVLALFGNRLHTSLKIFLMAVAVIDDLVAVLVIAVFYTDQLLPEALSIAIGSMIILWGFARLGITRAWPYLLIGAVLWMAVLKSGVHATVAGVILAWQIPLKPMGRKQRSLGKAMIHKLHPWVAFAIVPIFALANAGIPLHGLTLEHLLHPLPMGIILGLFIGKQLGIFGAVWLMVRLKLAKLPPHVSWGELYAVCMVAGIGFTMSLFIGTLAFSNPTVVIYIRLGVLVGSLLSAVCGYFLLSFLLRRKRKIEPL